MNRRQHLLIKLAEELGEVQQEVHKASLFGIDNKNPYTGITNLEGIVKEFNDVLAVMELLEEDGVNFMGLNSREHKEAKKAKVMLWLGYALSIGESHEHVVPPNLG